MPVRRRVSQVGCRCVANDTDVSRLLLGDEVSRAFEENVCPVALLVNNPRKAAIISIPGCRRLPRKALDTTECGILQCDES